jgi:conjugal transfer pilus assembly protein TraW
MAYYPRLLPLITIVWLSVAQAEVIGTYGDVYPIAEQDFLEFIQHRLATMQKTGQIAQLQKQLQTRGQQQAERPTPVSNITCTVNPKSWLFDPSITLPHDLKDANGRVFAKQGTRFNPLEQVHLSKTLLFYDADDPKQVKWAQTISQKLENKTKLILVKGSIAIEAQRFDRPAYFDQEGRLTARFIIQHTPAIVSQEGLRLRIQEVEP